MKKLIIGLTFAAMAATPALSATVRGYVGSAKLSPSAPAYRSYTYAPVAPSYRNYTYAPGYGSLAYAPPVAGPAPIITGPAPIFEDGEYLGTDPDPFIRLQLSQTANMEDY